MIAVDAVYNVSSSSLTCMSFACLQMHLINSALTLLVGHHEEHLACKKLSHEVQASLSVWSEMLMICIWSS